MGCGWHRPPIKKFLVLKEICMTDGHHWVNLVYDLNQREERFIRSTQSNL